MAHFQYANEVDLQLKVAALERKLAALERKLAQYEGVFRGVDVAVGEYWTAGRTAESYDHDEDGIIVGLEIDETGRRLMHLYKGGTGFSMYEDGRYV